MDANEIWQENKKFIVTVGSGLLVFMIGWMVTNSMYLSDIKSVRKSTTTARNDLKAEMFTAADLSLAQDENVALQELYTVLREAGEFQPRAEFVLGATPGTTPQAAYQTARERVYDRLGNLASRKRAFLPDGLDLEMLKTNNVDAIERHLHALDLLERVLVLAMEAGVRKVRSIEVKLDPAFQRGRGLGSIERTQISVDCVAPSGAVTRWVSMAETPLVGESSENPGVAALRSQALPIHSLELKSTQSKKDDDVRARIIFEVVRIHELQPADEDEE